MSPGAGACALAGMSPGPQGQILNFRLQSFARMSRSWCFCAGRRKPRTSGADPQFQDSRKSRHFAGQRLLAVASPKALISGKRTENKNLHFGCRAGPEPVQRGGLRLKWLNTTLKLRICARRPGLARHYFLGKTME